MSNVITPNLSLYEQLKNLHASMLKNGQAAVTSGHTADPDEGIHLKDIKLEKHELLLFKNVPDNDTDLGHYDMIEKSKLQTNLLNVLKKIFADAYGVDLVYYPTYNKWVFQVMFYFMSDEQFKQVCEDSGLEPGKDIFRALDSKINTLENAGNSVGQTLLAITNSQVQSTMDASKYASFSTAAKEYLSNMIFTNGDKKPRWINEHNYKLATVSNTGYNGHGTFWLRDNDGSSIGEKVGNNYKYIISSSAKTPVGDGIMIPPTSAATLKVQVFLRDEDGNLYTTISPISLNLPSGASRWEAGKEYTVNVSMTPPANYVEARGYLEDWDVETSEIDIEDED